jgi:hypothetical protein
MGFAFNLGRDRENEKLDGVGLIDCFSEDRYIKYFDELVVDFIEK